MLRFSITYDFLKNETLPLDYREGFVKLIKTALNIDHYRNTQDFNLSDIPVCFAIRFNQKPIIENKRIIVGKKIKLFISSPSFILSTLMYNNLLKIKRFSLYDNFIINPIISYQNEYEIRQNTVKLVTLSPIIIRNYQEKNRYVLPNEYDFNESFFNSLDEQWEKYRQNKLESKKNISFKITRYKKVIMSHYGGILLGFTGSLEINAAREILNFFYQSGIGYRRNHGFGFVEADRA